MAKKRKGRLVPVKKSVFDPRLGAIERTYYINPDKIKPKGRTSKGSSKKDNVQAMRDNIEQFAQKVAFCNW
jgi:hypothetical protein